MSTLNKLREQHATLVAEARKILESTEGAITGETEQRFDKLMEEADGLAKRIKKEQDLVDAESRFQARIAEKAEKAGKSSEEQAEVENRYAAAFDRWQRFGHEGMKPEQRELLEQRAQSISGGSPVGIYGGYLVPEAFSNVLDIALKAYGPMNDTDICSEIVTSTGADMPYPTTNDTSNKGAILGENQPITEQDVTFSRVTFLGYTYTSKLIRVSWQLLQDSAFNLDGFVTTVAGERLGRILNEHFTTGDNSSKPQGFITGATSGYTAAQQNAISYDDLVELQHSVDPAYRAAPKCRFMFNDATLKVLRKLKDADNRPLFWNDTGNLAAGVQAQLLGHPYSVNQDMASIGASAKTVAFGDFSKYFRRRIRGYTLVRLVERYADQLQTGFFIFCRFDGRLVDAGTRPIKYLTQKASSP